MTGSQFESRNQFFQKKEIVGKVAYHQFSQTPHKREVYTLGRLGMALIIGFRHYFDDF